MMTFFNKSGNDIEINNWKAWKAFRFDFQLPQQAQKQKKSDFLVFWTSHVFQNSQFHGFIRACEVSKLKYWLIENKKKCFIKNIKSIRIFKLIRWYLLGIYKMYHIYQYVYKLYPRSTNLSYCISGR